MIGNLLVKICSILVFISLVFFIVAPSAYVLETPGPSADVLKNYANKELIVLQGNPTSSQEETAKDSGQLLLLTVSVFGGPTRYFSTINAVPALFSNQQQILPVEGVYPPGKSASQVDDQNKEMMNESQNLAVTAATNFFKSSQLINSENFESLKTAQIQIDDIGGPSAGLVFALGLVQKVGGVNLTKGRSVAVTGTISADGKVGAIGGVKEKAATAISKNASLLIVPKGNLQEVENYHSQIKIIGVDSLEEAVNCLISESDGEA